MADLAKERDDAIDDVLTSVQTEPIAYWRALWLLATLRALRWALKHADYCTEQIEQRIAEVEGLK